VIEHKEVILCATEGAVLVSPVEFPQTDQAVVTIWMGHYYLFHTVQNISVEIILGVIG
jgi:hypothetical protein